MWLLEANREEFLKVISRKDKSKPIRLKNLDEVITKSLALKSMYLIWEFSPANNIPSCIYIHEDKLNDFMAWVTTFLPDYYPFSAYFRVIDNRIFEFYKNYDSVASSINKRGLLFACLIIAEALSQVKATNKEIFETPISFYSTLSYCYVQAISLNMNLRGITELETRWKELRRITQQKDRMLKDEEIFRFWSIVRDLINKHKNMSSSVVFALVRDIFGENIKNNEELDKTHSLKETQKRMVSSSREKRIAIFEDEMNHLEKYSNVDYGKASIICGFLGSLIKEGSFEFFELVKKYQNRFSTAILWFGFFTGVSNKCVIEKEFKCLGRKLLRGLKRERNMISVPVTDISYEELKVLYSDPSWNCDFKRDYASIVKVDILPNIISYLKLTKRESDKSNEDVPIKDDLYRKKLNELGYALDRVNYIYKELTNKKKFNKVRFKKEDSKSHKRYEQKRFNDI